MASKPVSIVLARKNDAGLQVGVAYPFAVVKDTGTHLHLRNTTRGLRCPVDIHFSMNTKGNGAVGNDRYTITVIDTYIANVDGRIHQDTFKSQFSIFRDLNEANPGVNNANHEPLLAARVGMSLFGNTGCVESGDESALPSTLYGNMINGCDAWLNTMLRGILPVVGADGIPAIDPRLADFRLESGSGTGIPGAVPVANLGGSYSASFGR